jgi:hypothetical protein
MRCDYVLIKHGFYSFIFCLHLPRSNECKEHHSVSLETSVVLNNLLTSMSVYSFEQTALRDAYLCSC